MKKILIGVSVAVVIIAAFLYFANNRNRTLSPPGKTELTEGSLSVSVSYSRPSVRGRLIFGTKEQGALLPYGVYWRLGANEPTEITFNTKVNFNGQSVEAGTYGIYAIPGKDSFEIRLNRERRWWGFLEPDYDQDFLTTQAPVTHLDTPVEQFTIRMEPLSGLPNSIVVIVEFSDTRLNLLVNGQ
jgi:hypothetical protein